MSQVKFNATLMYGYFDIRDEEGTPQASQYPDGKYKVTLANLNESALKAIESLNIKNPPKAHKNEELGVVITPRSGRPIAVVDGDGNPLSGNQIGWGSQASVLMGAYDCKYGRFPSISKIVVTDLVKPPEAESLEDVTETDEEL